MTAMQRSEEPQSSLRVPKLKLKLSKPFQNPVESEQSSTESDSDSENENDDEENISHEQGINTSNDMEINGEEERELNKPLFSQPESEMHNFPHGANESLSKPAVNDNSYGESMNESGSSVKNTSTDLDEGYACNDDNEYQAQQELSAPPQDESNQLNQLQMFAQIPTVKEQTTAMRQTTIAPNADNMTNMNVSFTQNTLFFPQKCPTVMQ